MTRSSDKTHIIAAGTTPEAVDTKQKMQFSGAATDSFEQNYVLGNAHKSISSCILYI